MPETTAPETLVVLGLGSNRGDSRAILEGAADCLAASLREPRCSGFYLTDPMYVLDQPRFLNCAVCGYSAMAALELLAWIQAIEADFGRNRAVERRRGERTLDIDILLFGEAVLDLGPTLLVPHPGLRERRFALEPLLELLPDARDPGTGERYAEVLAALEPQGIYYAGAGRL